VVERAGVFLSQPDEGFVEILLTLVPDEFLAGVELLPGLLVGCH
jgi:hypothetical protein